MEERDTITEKRTLARFWDALGWFFCKCSNLTCGTGCLCICVFTCLCLCPDRTHECSNLTDWPPSGTGCMRLHELGWWPACLGRWSRKLKRHQHSPSLLRLPTFRPAPGTKTVWGTIAALSKLFLQEHFPQPRAERQSGAIRDSEAHVQYGSSCEQTPKDPKRLH